MKGLIYKFVMAIGLIMASVTASASVTYVYTDAQGTPLAEADASGTITATFDYKPYGSQALGTPKAGPGYTGHVNDPDTGFVYMQARYYDPSTGHFLSSDPVKPSVGNLFNLNRYNYTNNNPLRYTDPDGRCVDGLTCGLPPKPETSPEPTSSPTPVAPEPRKSSSTLRRLWEKKTGQKWPKDPATGRNQDVAHKDPVADGGSPNDPDNYEPKPHDQHMQEHKDNGDFKRWGARSGGGKSSGAANPSTPETPAAPEAQAPIEPAPIVEPPVVEPLIIEPIGIP
ncbi:RHS repeat domain-containing protein [Dyella sp.]|uniref:RHS repeat domain-containing protein n=1 Tax=Dyella sp. TaxID=1869338 RepID=UPI003F7F06EF